MGPDSWRSSCGNWGYLAQGALVSVSAKNQSPAQGYLVSGISGCCRWPARGQLGSGARLIAPRGPPAPAGAPPQPHHHRPGNEPGGLEGVRGSREMRLSAVGRWPWWLLTGNGSAWSKAHVSGPEFLCPLPSFHGPCLRKPGIDQIASSMPTPGGGAVTCSWSLGHTALNRAPLRRWRHNPALRPCFTSSCADLPSLPRFPH